MPAALSPLQVKNWRLDKLERMSLWSCAANSLFSSARRPDAPRVIDRPLSFGETCLALVEIAKARPLGYPVRDLLRVCLSQMLVAGYRPTRCRGDFTDLLQIATGRRLSNDAAEKKLMEFGYDQYGKDAAVSPPPPRPEYLAAHSSGEVAFPYPTEISYDGTAYVVTKRMLLHCPATPLATFIDPENWVALGPFFEVTSPEKLEPTGRGWRGVLHEVFRIDWNGWMMEHFDVRLKIEHTVTDDLIRADYSLLYDDHDQLHWDDGIVEIQRVAGYNDWCWYTGRKSLKFASDFLNLLSPGVLFMGLEREALGIAALARVFSSGDDEMRSLGRLLIQHAPSNLKRDRRIPPAKRSPSKRTKRRKG